MAKFRKKPVVIEAVQWTRNVDEVEAFCAGAASFEFAESGPQLSIRTLEGVMDARHGDWIIRGVKGELYPCRPDIFAATYEPAEWKPTPALDVLREAWLDIPWSGEVDKGDGHWMQTLINAVSAIVDPDRTLREDPEARRRGRLAQHRQLFARYAEQVSLSEKHGITEQVAHWTAKRDAVHAECFAEFGINLTSEAR